MDKIKEGETLFIEGRLDEAENFFLNILSEHPENSEILNDLGVIHYAKGNIKDSEDYFVKALGSDGKNLDALQNLADFYQEQGRLVEAANCLERYISIGTKDTSILNRIGLIYAKMNDATRAEDAFEASLKLDPEQKTVKEHLEEIERRNGAKFKVEEKKRLLFLELPGVGNFLEHITKNLKNNYYVKHVKTTEHEKIVEHVNWADIIWLEWANEMAIHVTNKIPQVKDKKVICRLHGYEVFTDMPAQIDWSVVDLLVFVAKHKQEIFNRKFKVQSLSQAVIRNGVNTNEFTIADKKQNTKRLVFLGHLNFRKGLHMLLQFYHQLLKQDPEYYLYIRGEFQDQRLEMSTRTMIRELSLTNKLEFVDWIDDLNAWLSDKSHILSFSIEESFHYAVGNGMAAGLKPVIHAWNESREIWPEDFIFSDLDGFINIMLDKQYEPHKYRQMLFDHSLDFKRQLLEIEELLKEINAASKTEKPISNAVNVENSLDRDLSSEKQIFIGGTGRSGTTLFKNLLNTHKKIASFGETKVFDLARRFLNQLKYCSEEDKEREVCIFKKRWINDLYHFKVPWTTHKNNGDRGLHIWFTKEEIQVSLPILDGLINIQSEDEGYRVFGTFINHLFSAYAIKHNKPFWSEKTPSNAVHASFFARCFCNMKLINVIRDGRDVACSLMKVPWGMKDPKKALDWWANNLLQAIEVQSDIPKNSFLNVRYEDIIFRTDKTLKRVMKFLDIDWDDCLLEFEISSDSIGRYKKELSSDIQEYATKRYGKLLKAFQYSV